MNVDPFQITKGHVQTLWRVPSVLLPRQLCERTSVSWRSLLQFPLFFLIVLWGKPRQLWMVLSSNLTRTRATESHSLLTPSHMLWVSYPPLHSPKPFCLKWTQPFICWAINSSKRHTWKAWLWTLSWPVHQKLLIRILKNYYSWINLPIIIIF